jgi:PhnB protein
MPERSFAEQLDQMIDGLLGQPMNEPLAGQDDLAAMASIAADLRDLPSAGFKARLKADLQRRITMTAATLSYVREGFHCVTPYVVAGQGAEMIDFVKQVFGAQEMSRGIGSGGGIHCELRIGDSMLMMGGGGAYTGPRNPAALHYYVENPDEVYQRALQAGATSLVEPMEDHGERFACVGDAFGNEWYIARRLSGRYVGEGMHDINVYFHPVDAMRFVEFLEHAFSAGRVEVYQGPDGVMQHAKMRIGDSVVEIGEAHSWWQPLATMIYLYVPNVDEVYQKALAAGASSVSEPVDQPYGDRNAGVKDPFGHTWYLSSPIRK